MPKDAKIIRVAVAAVTANSATNKAGNDHGRSRNKMSGLCPRSTLTHALPALGRRPRWSVNNRHIRGYFCRVEPVSRRFPPIGLLGKAIFENLVTSRFQVGVYLYRYACLAVNRL